MWKAGEAHMVDLEFTNPRYDHIPFTRSIEQLNSNARGYSVTRYKITDTFQEYLDFHTSYEVSKALGVSKQSIDNIRNTGLVTPLLLDKIVKNSDYKGTDIVSERIKYGD